MCRRIEILKSVSWSILFQIELADGTVLDTFCSFQHQKIQRSATRGVSSLGSARNLAREPHVFKSSARLGSISGSSM